MCGLRGLRPQWASVPSNGKWRSFGGGGNLRVVVLRQCVYWWDVSRRFIVGNPTIMPVAIGFIVHSPLCGYALVRHLGAEASKILHRLRRYDILRVARGNPDLGHDTGIQLFREFLQSSSTIAAMTCTSPANAASGAGARLRTDLSFVE